MPSLPDGPCSHLSPVSSQLDPNKLSSWQFLRISLSQPPPKVLPLSDVSLSDRYLIPSVNQWEFGDIPDKDDI